MKGQIEKVAAFLNKTLSEKQLDELVEHLRFDNFSKNESVNGEAGKETGFLGKYEEVMKKIAAKYIFVIVNQIR